MMPPLPPPRYEANGRPWFDDEQLLAYGRAVAEAKYAEIAALRRRCQTYRRALRQLNKAHNTLWRVLQIRTERIDAALAKEKP
jgi:hypothetical protein